MARRGGEEENMESERHKVDVEIDVYKMQREMEREIWKQYEYRDPADMNRDYCIFKIPEELSKHNDKAYAPQAFSIGLFNYSNPRTKATQTIKLKYLHDFLCRSDWPLRDLIEAVRVVHDRVRRHYDRAVDDLISPEEFIKLLVVDGCFVVELFLKNSDRDRVAEDDPIFSVPWMRQYLNHDLVLLENQIPWMVLNILYWTCLPSESDLVRLTLDFFHPIFSVTRHPGILPADGMNNHILYLLRNALLSTAPNRDLMSPDKTGNSGLESVMLLATALEESGIKIQSSADPTLKSIFDVTFKDGVLEIPQLLVHDSTDALFRNLVALELYCPNYDSVITSYVKLLDDLVQTTADMKLLCDNKVVHNTLCLEKATRIFNQASEEYSGMKENHYSEVIDAMDKYRRRRRGYYILRWRVYVRDLKRVYFSHPWAAISTVAASFILIFTFLQTLFTIMSYK